MPKKILSSIWMRVFKAAALLMFSAAFVSAGFAIPAQAQTFTEFDVPGGSDTEALSINATGAVAGTYLQSNGTTSGGFLRAADGTITTFVVSGAGPLGTYAGSINSKGRIAGSYRDSDKISHGFLRLTSGKIVKFDPPGTTDTYPQSINSQGAISGYYFDSANAAHGFVRAPDGTITSFDVTGADNTYAYGNNDKGDITGYYRGSDNVSYGFLRLSDGTITTFGKGVPEYGGTTPFGINDADMVAGYFVNPDRGGNKGYLRSAAGKVTYFSAIRDGSTGAASINKQGDVTGSYTDEENAIHGFIRLKDGAITTFDAPGEEQGTYAASLNGSDVIAGYYFDGSNTFHGFIRTP